jgi:hypothetical protein
LADKEVDMRIIFLADDGRFAEAEIADEDLAPVFNQAHTRAFGQPGLRSPDPKIRARWERRVRAYEEAAQAAHSVMRAPTLAAVRGQ